MTFTSRKTSHKSVHSDFSQYENTLKQNQLLGTITETQTYKRKLSEKSCVKSKVKKGPVGENDNYQSLPFL